MMRRPAAAGWLGEAQKRRVSSAYGTSKAPESFAWGESVGAHFVLCWGPLRPCSNTRGRKWAGDLVAGPCRRSDRKRSQEVGAPLSSSHSLERGVWRIALSRSAGQGRPGSEAP